MTSAENDRTLTLLTRIAQGVQQWNDTYNNGKPLFPPVTEAQVRAAEQHMGFRLPSFLSLLYTQIGNGGFGPAYGICPLEVLEQRQSRSGWHLNPKIEQMLMGDPVLMVQCLDGKPDGWVSLCDLGCGGAYELDLYTGHIYDSWTYAVHIDVADEHIRERLIEEGFDAGIRHCFSSIEVCFEDWLSPLQWQEPPTAFCLGVAGSHGFTGACYSVSGEDMGFDVPKHEEFEEDEHSYVSFDEIADSEDWEWYQRQPPADAE